MMVDETTDKSNKEQRTLVVRWICDDFIASEEVLGLFVLSVCSACAMHCGNNEGCRSAVPDSSDKVPQSMLQLMEHYGWVKGWSSCEDLRKCSLKLCSHTVLAILSTFVSVTPSSSHQLRRTA